MRHADRRRSGPHLVGWAADSKKLYLTEAQGTNLRLLALPLEGPPVALNRGAVTAGSGVSLNATRTRFGLSWETTSQPPEAFVSEVSRFEPKQVSRANADLPRAPLGRTEVVRWKSADGLPIEGLLTYPIGFKKGQRYPLLLDSAATGPLAGLRFAVKDNIDVAGVPTTAACPAFERTPTAHAVAPSAS